MLLRNLIWSTVLSCIFITGNAQNYEDLQLPRTTVKNVIRYNPYGTLVWKSVPLYYERKLNKVIGFSMGVGYIIPHHVNTSKFSFESEWLNGAFTDGRITGHYITPELKFYLKGEGPNGFYIGRYFRYMKYGIEFTAKFDDNAGSNVDVNAALTLKEYGTGRQYGYQWIIADKWSIDWFFAGFRYSTYKLGVKVDASVDAEAWTKFADKIKRQYDDYVTDAGLDFLKGRLPLDPTNPKVSFSYPFEAVNFRHGISFGYSF